VFLGLVVEEAEQAKRLNLEPSDQDHYVSLSPSSTISDSESHTVDAMQFTKPAL
jgi:hypothetical protein